MPDCTKKGKEGESRQRERRSREKAYKEEERSENEAEDQWAGKVGVVHDVRVDGSQRVHNGEGLLEDVVKVDSEFCSRRRKLGHFKQGERKDKEACSNAPSSKGGSPSIPVHGVKAFHQFCTTICPPNAAPLPPFPLVLPPILPPSVPLTSGRASGSSDGRPE